ncbi:hypothetical protein K505DRAFT_44413 [Melanomma pulvis-pyrius CBS 109.77]|uniref:Uncharacterized protein n=1 Tax=Melanomma pulvis-pyrius CBS 109.77 TaxID=1314802 RepID=A0A6A6XTS6_9PLEO|nr:hypothetical protein K505DRAFT_44413 [Melanomma pulvis-pyrius CBS 109.77]
MPGVTFSPFNLVAQTCSDGIEEAVQGLKQDRDNFKAIAGQYKRALLELVDRFKELEDICVATQAELANEQTVNRRLRDQIELGHNDGPRPENDTDGLHGEPKHGLALVMEYAQLDIDGLFIPLACANFRRVEQFAVQGDFNPAIIELNRLLRGPLSADARVEGLLLKSIILRAFDPDSLSDALAACNEAMELCDRHPTVKCFLSKIQYYRGICLYRLKMVSHALGAFAAVGRGEIFYDSAMEYRKSCEEEQVLTDGTMGRYGFEEQRTMAEMQPSQPREIQRDRSRALFSSSKPKRLSLPSRWLATYQRASEQDGNSNSIRAAPKAPDHDSNNNDKGLESVDPLLSN